jgi:hypothetical protein
MFDLTKSELVIFRKLNSPIKIQDFLDTLPINWNDEYLSPRKVLEGRKCHCMEGALLAAAILWANGEKPLIMDLKVVGDTDHVVTLYKRNGYWGAISKTNHATVRFRDPVYKTLRELALSYFHEYFNDDTGKKALRSFAGPFDLSKLGKEWITSEKDLEFIAEKLDKARHYSLLPKNNARFIRKADNMELRVGRITEWKKIS